MKKKSLLIVAIFGVAISAASFNTGPNNASATVPGDNELVTMKHDNSESKMTATTQGSSLSRDGKFALFLSPAGDNALATTYPYTQAVVRNLSSDTNELASVSSAGSAANNNVDNPRISETGRYVVFDSKATNLVAGVTYNGYGQIFMRDRVANTVVLVSQTSTGALANNTTYARDVSNDGRFILFSTNASSLGATSVYQQLFIKDMITGELTVVSKSSAGMHSNDGVINGRSSMSCDGSFVLFASAANNLTSNDTNGKRDVFLADIRNGFVITNLTQTGNQDSNAGDISCNGQYMTIQTTSTTLTSDNVNGTYNHIFFYDRISGELSIADRNPSTGAVDPRDATNSSVSDKGLVMYTWGLSVDQVYIAHMKTGVRERLSSTSTGIAANNRAFAITNTLLSSEGNLAMYATLSTNLSGTVDLNGTYDLYVSKTGY